MRAACEAEKTFDGCHRGHGRDNTAVAATIAMARLTHTWSLAARAVALALGTAGARCGRARRRAFRADFAAPDEMQRNENQKTIRCR